MAMTHSSLPSDLVNSIHKDTVNRRAKNVRAMNKEKSALLAGQPAAVWSNLGVQLLAAGWMCWALASYAGLGDGLYIGGVHMAWVPCAVASALGMSLVYLSMSLPAMMADMQGIGAKFLASTVLILVLGVSIFTSTYSGLVVYETAGIRSAETEDTGSRKLDALNAVRDTAKSADTAYQIAVDALRTAEKQRADSAEAVREAIDAKAAWWANIVATHGATSAAANRRSRSDHPQRVNHNNAIAAAQALLVDAESEAAMRRVNANNARVAVVDAKGMLEKANVKYANASEAGGMAYQQAADMIGGVFGTSGDMVMVFFIIAIGVIGSVALPVMSSAQSSSLRPAMQQAERHQHQQNIRRMAAETINRAPLETYVAPSPQPAPVAAPVAPAAAPQVDAQDEEPDIATLKSQYASKCADAVSDASAMLLDNASFAFLKRKYQTNDDGATAIRHALVDDDLAFWDGKQCKVKK